MFETTQSLDIWPWLERVQAASPPLRPQPEGQIFTCVGALAIGGGLQHVDADLLGWWLCERQVKAGGLNGEEGGGGV
jgi:hypothetical protein